MSTEPKQKHHKKEVVPDIEHAHRTEIEWKPREEFAGLELAAEHFKMPFIPGLVSVAEPSMELDVSPLLLVDEMGADFDEQLTNFNVDDELFDISIELELVESSSDDEEF